MVSLGCIHRVEIAVFTQWFIFSTHFHHCVEKAKCAFSQRRSQIVIKRSIARYRPWTLRSPSIGGLKYRWSDKRSRIFSIWNIKSMKIHILGLTFSYIVQSVCPSIYRSIAWFPSISLSDWSGLVSLVMCLISRIPIGIPPLFPTLHCFNSYLKAEPLVLK